MWMRRRRPHAAGRAGGARGVLPVALLAMCLVPGTAGAQGTTGELAGRVVDRAGRAVPGARIALPAVGIDVTSDDEGRFLLADIPVGRHELLLSAGGASVGTVTVRVSADRRAQLELRLGDRPGDPVVARTTLVPLASGSVVTGDELRALPADDVREVLRSESGVVETDAPAGPALRASFPGDAAVFVDGVPWHIAAGRAFGIGLPIAAIEEIGVRTGPLGPGFGDAEAGLINLVTRSGGPELGGRLTAVTDGLFGGGTGVGFTRLDALVGGSVGRAVSLFATLSVQGEDAVRRGAGTGDVLAFRPGAADTVVTAFNGVDSVAVTIPQFVQVSGSCDAAANFEEACRGRAFPYDGRTALAGTLRADWRYGRGSGIAVTVFLDRAQRRYWPGWLAFDPDAYQGQRQSARAVIARWAQRVGEGLSVNLAVSRQAEDLVSGVLDTVWEAAHRDPALGIDLSRMGFLVDFDRFSADTGAGAVTRLETADDWERLIANVRTNTGTRVPFLDQNQLRLAQPYRMNPWAAATGLPTAGVDAGYSILAQRRHWIVRGVATWRLGPWHRLRAGADWRASDLRLFEGPLLQQTFMDVYRERPRQSGVFGDVRFTTSSATLEMGVRWDRFDPNTIFPVVPGRIFTHPNYDPVDLTDPADSVFAESRVRTVVLPSMRAAWTPLAGTVLRAGVSRQARHPDESAVYANKNADLAYASTASGFGRDVDWPRTWLVELGVGQRLGGGITADVAGWLSTRDRELVFGSRRFYDPVRADSILLVAATNRDTASAKGLDVRLTAPVGYSVQDARETFVVTGSRKHTLAGRLGVRDPEGTNRAGWLGTLVRGGEAWILFRVASGLPYTRTVNAGLGTLSPAIQGQASGELFASATPAIRELDLKVVKRFTTGSLRWGLVVDARNLFGFTNTLRVYTETGTITNDLHRELVIAPERARLEAEAGGRLVSITKAGRQMNAADLRGDCGTWSGGPVNCVLLRRAEARWGDGDGLYDEEEQRAAFGALYDLFFGPWTLRGTPRHLRIGLEVGI
jgi:hypothetical protein